uniref:Uncharacterized protein n=1 Tax=Candidatus Kentrum sp. LFY TaxID=2126342 RepID=A0A450UQ16_9GAMM|nr:MAG: hypothetical protein BECKLFY1418B_GA0070995_10415 [Candidatus Kentron sp. LFY]VFJ94648.1 MAG: hypothetical protein BECKLFY1418A_GA0070994_104224 [Candidatus Kentron sp. LFY]
MLHRFEAKLSLDALFSPWNRVRGSCTNRWKRVGNPAMAVMDTLDIDPVRSPQGIIDSIQSKGTEIHRGFRPCIKRGGNPGSSGKSVTEVTARVK